METERQNTSVRENRSVTIAGNKAYASWIAMGSSVVLTIAIVNSRYPLLFGVSGWVPIVILIIALSIPAFVAVWYALSCLAGQRNALPTRCSIGYTIAVSFICAWVAVYVQKGHEVQNAIEWIENNDGQVLFRSNSFAEKWLALVVGDHYFSRVTSVSICGHKDSVRFSSSPERPFDESEMRRLSPLNELCRLELRDLTFSEKALDGLPQLPNLEHLILDGSNVTDAAVEEVTRFRRLRWLSLANTRITDIGVRRISRLNGLQMLDIGGTQISDHAIDIICDIPTLEGISLSYTHVTDVGFNRLAKSTQIAFLVVDGISVSDSTFATIGDLSSLEQLSIRNVICLDRGLTHLSKLHNLQALYLSGSSLSESATSDLEKLTQLRYLEVSSGQFSDGDLRAIKRANPLCVITIISP